MIKMKPLLSEGSMKSDYAKKANSHFAKASSHYDKKIVKLQDDQKRLKKYETLATKIIADLDKEIGDAGAVRVSISSPAASGMVSIELSFKSVASSNFLNDVCKTIFKKWSVNSWNADTGWILFDLLPSNKKL